MIIDGYFIDTKVHKLSLVFALLLPIGLLHKSTCRVIIKPLHQTEYGCQCETEKHAECTRCACNKSKTTAQDT